ncbi:MAG: ACT domain-containing protein [Actinomycetota bacterium]|nr:ACT domain-containing protein [Actinomycetota bacterium]
MQDHLSQRERLISTAVPGTASARRLARLADEALADLAGKAATSLDAQTSWALIALGGYGSGALLPGSDLDLLVISNACPATLKPFVEALLYPLWDAGLKVGHQVRTRKQQLLAVRTDMPTLTATLSGRTIAGDDLLGADVLHACAADARKRRTRVLRELHSRPRPGSPYLLEPNLKEGAGGRRDFDELTWTAAVLTGAPQSDPSALVSLGVLEPAELERLNAAADAVATARWELQLAGAGPTLDEEVVSGARVNLECVQQALADTFHLVDRARRRTLRERPAETARLSPAQIVESLATGRTALPALEEAAWSGRLDHLIPGMRALMTLRRPGLAHTLTVGAHCLASAAIIGDVAAGREGVDTVTARSVTAIPDMRVPIVAALVHDIGKEQPGPSHAERGATAARATALLFGLADRAGDVSSLVENHLVLADTATHRDLDDEDAVLLAADRIGKRSLVAPLHVLTVADSIATGPGAWSDWHAALLGKLVTRLDAALSNDVDRAGMAARAEDVRTAALSLVRGDTDGRRRAFVLDAHVRYLSDRTPADVVRHAELVARASAAGAPRTSATEVTLGPFDGAYRLAVATPDRTGLFATLAGVIALSGLDILGVEATSTSQGIALDTFTVRSATLAAVDPQSWTRLERNLSAALRGRLAIGVRLAERQRHYRPSSQARPKVTIDTDDPFAAVLVVHAADRVGLLYDIARAIAESGLDIQSVTATTRGGTAHDVFRLTDAAGEVPREAGLLGQLAMRLRKLR